VTRPLIDLECPRCYGAVRVEDTDRDQHEQCADCGRHYSVTYDAEMDPEGNWRGGHILRECEGPDWREIEGDLRFHGRN
jgi:hypothetical protein